MTTNNNTNTENNTANETMIDEIIQDTNETEIEYNFEVIENFQASTKGAERIVSKGIKLINRFSNIWLNQWDKEDAISACYIAVMEVQPTESDTPLNPLSQAYFGIATREQFRAGYNALQKVVYQNMTSGKSTDYSQEYGLSGTRQTDELAEIELDMTLNAILSEQFRELLEYKLQGLSSDEIAEITGIKAGTVRKYQMQIRELIKQSFKVDTEGRKKPQPQRKK